MDDPESWLSAVVSKGAVLANEIPQLADCLAGTDAIDVYADALAARLRDLETAASR